MKGNMKKLVILIVVALALVGGNVMAKGQAAKHTIKCDPDYKASTDLSIGAWTTIREGTDYELTGYAITDEFQLNLLYQAAFLDSDIDNFNHYWDPMNAMYNFPDNEEYVLNISEAGGLTIYEYEGLTETVGDKKTQWTLTAWHQTILAGDIKKNKNGTITLRVRPKGIYRPFIDDPPVNDVEVFDGTVDCEVLGYTFEGDIGDIGDGSTLSVVLQKSKKGKK